MTSRRDVEAIPVLIGLLDLETDRRGSVERALARYGEAAEGALKAHALAHWSTRRSAIRALSRIASRAQFRRLGCF